MKYGEWLDEWLKYSVKHRVKDSTYRKYKRQAERYLLPSFGEREMEDIDALALQRFVADLSERGLAPGTVNGIVTTLKNSLRTAVIEGTATEHHADRIRRPPMRERQVICFEKTEQEKIERYVRTRLHGRANVYGVLLDLYTGLRIGELLALRWGGRGPSGGDAHGVKNLPRQLGERAIQQDYGYTENGGVRAHCSHSAATHARAVLFVAQTQQ